MRAPETLSRASSLSSVIRWAAAIGGSAAGLVACADSLHLDPGGDGGKKTTGSTGSTTSSTGGGGVGGSAQTGCASNQECGYPTPLCDTIAGTCVECLTLSDCAGSKPGTVCSFGACVCATADDAGPALTYCGDGKAGHCADTQTSPSDCGACGKKCFGSCALGACVDPWRPMTATGAPAARSRHVSVWAKSVNRMFVWGGAVGGMYFDTGGLYDPVKDAWTPTNPVNAPTPRSGATAVWDDKENAVIVWGGVGPSGALKDGGMYDPATDQWKTIPPSILTARSEHTAVWATFAQPLFGNVSYGMMIWGGTSPGGTHLADGALYDPLGKQWIPLEPGGPTARGQHAAVWNSGTQVMVVAGGFGGPGPTDDYLGDAWSFDPAKTGVTPWTDLGASFTPRARATAVFGISTPAIPFMVVFGGANAAGQLPDGAIFRLGAWSPLDPLNFPEAREGHTAVWIEGTVNRMFVLGGVQGGTTLGTLWALDPTGPSWKQLESPPGTRAHHTAVTDGTQMFVWGGISNSGSLDTGAIYTYKP